MSNYIEVCNGQVFYDKMINGSEVTVENINGKENEVIAGIPIGTYNEYLFVDVWNGNNSASSNVLYAYNTKTKKKTHIVTLDDSSSFFFDNKCVSESHPLYYIKNGVLYKAVPGAANSIASVGTGKGYSYQLTNVLETPTDYFISFLCFNNQSGFTQLLQINKTSKKKTSLFESPILLSYMPSTFYITDVHTDINGKVYFNAPKIKKTGSYFDVTPMGHTYDLKTNTDKVHEDSWMCLYSR